MTKQQAIKIFKQEYPALAKDKDRCKKQLAWAGFIDSLCRNGMITQKQYDTWGNPDFCK